MPVEWKSARAAGAGQAVIGRLNQTLGLNDEGAVTLGDLGQSLTTSAGILASSARISAKVPEEQRTVLVRRAVIEERKKGLLHEDSLLRAIAEKEWEYLSRPLEPYVLLTTLSVDHFKTFSSVRYNGATLTFTRHPPKRFTFPDRASELTEDHLPWLYTVVRVHVRSRDERSAGDVALDRLDAIRGMWNFHQNRGRWKMNFGASLNPVNEIMKGPIHTLHRPTGEPAGDMIWWEPGQVGMKRWRRKRLEQEYRQLREFDRDIRIRAREVSQESAVARLFIAYARALDERERHAAFLKLWALLEDLTATGYGSYENTIRRAAFLYRHGRYRRLVLRHLRDWRNRIVHEGAEPEEAENMVNELRHHVEHLLWVYTRHIKTFGSLQQFGQFLSLPKGRRELIAHLRQVEFAKSVFEDDWNRTSG